MPLGPCCHTCLYSFWDKGLWMTSLSTGFPHWPACANHPDHLGQMRTTPAGGPCRNYRPKPPEPAQGACQVPLSDGSYAYVDAADFEEIMKYHWHSYNGGYAVRWEKGKTIYMHRQIMKPLKGMMVDHKNHNRADNTRDNLRVCSRRQNILNQRTKGGTASRFKGVAYRTYRSGRRKCYAEIRIDGKKTYLGTFDKEEDAARAYDRAAVEHHGDFAYLNFPEEWPPERRAEIYAQREAAKPRTEDSGQRTAKRKRPRATTQGKKPRRTTGHESRATAAKKHRAETRGRLDRKDRTKSPRVMARERKMQDAQRATRRKPPKKQ